MMLYPSTDKYVGGSLDRYGEFCEGEAEMFAQLLSPGQVVIEVGANIGSHTVHLAKLVGDAGLVIAFEPQRVIFQLLCANLALNDVLNTRAIQAASGEQPGTLRVPDIDYRAPDSNFGGVSLVSATGDDQVPVLPLDSLQVASLRLLKVDVEGMELSVLLGGRATIQRHRPVIYVENDRPERSPALIAFLLGQGYDCWWHLPPLFNPNNFAANPENVFPGIVSINMLCLPCEQDWKIDGLRKVRGPEDRWNAP